MGCSSDIGNGDSQAEVEVVEPCKEEEVRSAEMTLRRSKPHLNDDLVRDPHNPK
jgi:hypothetical protein